MSFRESVIIPLKMFETCTLEKDTKSVVQSESYPSGVQLKLNSDRVQNETKNILQQEKYPSDVRLKLYNDERIRKKLRAEKAKEAKLETGKLVRKKILDEIPVEKQPFVNSIIDIIEKRQNDIKWNENYEIFLNCVKHPDLNIVKIFKFLTKSSIVTAEADIPAGAKVVYDKLISIGVPKTWIFMSYPRVSQRVRQQLQPRQEPVLQLGQGKKRRLNTWLTY